MKNRKRSKQIKKVKNKMTKKMNNNKSNKVKMNKFKNGERYYLIIVC